jgi:putative transposase
MQLHYKDLLVSHMSELKPTTSMAHSIQLTDYTPIRQAKRAVPYHRRAEVNRLIREMRDNGIIRPSHSAWSSPMHLVRKGDSFRITIDYRALNERTIKDAYNLPMINVIIALLTKAKFRSKFDCLAGYYQIPLDENSCHLTAFPCEEGLMEYVRLPMGLTNSTAVFSRYMSEAMEGLCGVCEAHFIDDVFVFSDTLIDHIRDLKLVADRLRAANLFLKESKCHFISDGFEALGHHISGTSIAMKPSKVQALLDWQRPKNEKEVHSLLGLCAYYNIFLQDYATILGPLTDLISRGKQKKVWAWTEKCEEAFQTIIRVASSNPMLANADFTRSFILDTDASDTGLGAVLSQNFGNKLPCFVPLPTIDELPNETDTPATSPATSPASNTSISPTPAALTNDDERPIGYFSKRLNKAQRNYSVSEREMLSVVLAVEFFKFYLSGAHFWIRSDHKILTFLKSKSFASPRLNRWRNRLTDHYDFTLVWRSGKNHQNADSLSRMNFPSVSKEEDEAVEDEEVIIFLIYHAEEENTILVIIIAEAADSELITSSTHELFENNSLMDQRADAQLSWIFDHIENPESNEQTPTDPDAAALKKLLPRFRVTNNNLYLSTGSAESNDGLKLLFVVPKAHVPLVFHHTHTSITSGHFGINKTIARVGSRFWWLRWRADVSAFVTECHSCQMTKTGLHCPGTLQPIRPTRPGELITSDIKGPLPESEDGNKFILVMIDHFSKFIKLYPLHAIDATETARAISLHFCSYGAPLAFLSDQGRNYQSHCLQEVFELLDVHQLRSSPYWPAGDGCSERAIQTTMSTLRHFVEENQETWDTKLPMLEFAMNSAVHSTTKHTPWLLQFGREPRIPIDLFFSGLNEEQQQALTASALAANEATPAEIVIALDAEMYANELKTSLTRAFTAVAANRDRRMEAAKILHERKVRAANYKEGDNVLVRDSATKVGKCKKLSFKYLGPFQVISIRNRLTYVLRSYATNKLSHVHQARLKKYHGPIDRGAIGITETSTLNLPTSDRQNETLAEVNDIDLTPTSESLNDVVNDRPPVQRAAARKRGRPPGRKSNPPTAVPAVQEGVELPLQTTSSGRTRRPVLKYGFEHV